MQRIFEVDPPQPEKPGEILLQHGLAEEAYPFITKDFNKEDFRCWTNLAACLRIMSRLDEAKEAAKKALELNQRAHKAWYNLAYIMEDLGHYEHGLEAITIAYRLMPVDKEVAFHYARSNMRMGKWKEVRDQFEFGREELCWNPFKVIPKLRCGDDLTGKRVLVLHEGGYGDFFWFMRYLKLLKDWGCHVTYLAWRRQADFTQHRCPWVDRVLKADDVIDESLYDVQLPLWSLLSTLDGPMPMTEPYIVPHKLTIPKNQFTVGLAWYADEMGMARRTRSIPMELLEPFGNISVNWMPLSLVKEIPEWCSDCREVLATGWEPTASIIERCDLIITVDTATVHLAGAMGKETWLLLPHNSDWRWGTPENCFVSKWYPSVRAFRNSDPVKWEPVIERVKTKLEARLCIPV